MAKLYVLVYYGLSGFGGKNAKTKNIGVYDIAPWLKPPAQIERDEEKDRQNLRKFRESLGEEIAKGNIKIAVDEDTEE